MFDPSPHRSRFGAISALVAGLITTFLACAGAQGQTQSSSASSNPAENWRVECTSDGKALDCRAIQQAVQRQGNSQQTIAIMSVRFPIETKKPVLMLQLPLGIKLADPVTIRIDDGVSEKFDVQTCTQIGCFVGTPVSDALLGAMRSGKVVRIVYQNMNRQPVTITLSLTGFALAYDKVK